MRKVLPLNENWQFSKAGPTEALESVTLPHTWNAVDGQDGGTTIIAAPATIPAGWKNRRCPAARRSGWSLRGRPTPPRSF